MSGETTLPPAAQRVSEALRALGVDAQVVVKETSARTAEEAAASVGVGVGQIVKSLVFLAGEAPVLVLVSGPNRLDTERLGALTKAKVRRADADVVRAATGYAIGGIPPVGLAGPLPVYCDRDLLAYDVVWAAAGTPFAVFPIAPQRLVEVTGATVAELAVVS